MRKAFIEFLTAEAVIPPAAAQNLHTLLRRAPEPIGSIAFSYGMVSGGDIDVILDRQRQTHQPFGEIAMELGVLTRAQVETLLQVQQIRAATDIAEALALAGLCSIDEVIPQLGRFLSTSSRPLTYTSR